jgi:diguanylate cyclase (GGDEF)-like protein/PAS domain S-box-containing protein
MYQRNEGVSVLMDSLRKPVYHLIMTLLAVFLTEIAVSAVMSLFPPLQLYKKMLINGISLVVIAFPFLYFHLFKPYVTERNNAEDKLKKSEYKYRSLVESTEDTIYLVDKDCRYIFVNPNHIERMGLSEGECIGRSYGEFHSTREEKIFTANVNAVFETGESVKHEHKSMRDGRYFLQTLSPVKDSSGNVIAVTIVSKEITTLKTMEHKLHILSMTDELTGLYNRRGFFDLIGHHLKLADRDKKEIFMLYADLDNLKKINDTFGHDEGDKVIVEIANILASTYRESDIIARIGGDEFIVFPLSNTAGRVDSIVSRLHKNIETHNAKAKRSYNLSISAGVSLYDPSSPQTPDELLAQADSLMYEHKRTKKEVAR